MTREDLEAVIWQHWPVCASPEEGRHAVQAILAAADLYRDDTPALTRQRRAVLDEGNPLRRRREKNHG